MGPEALGPTRLGATQKPPQPKSGRWRTAGPVVLGFTAINSSRCPFQPLNPSHNIPSPTHLLDYCPVASGKHRTQESSLYSRKISTYTISRLPAPTVLCRQNERACVQAAVAEDLREVEDKAGQQGSWGLMQCALPYFRKLIAIRNNTELPHSPAAFADLAYHIDLFRLWTEEPNMDIRTSGHLPVP